MKFKESLVGLHIGEDRVTAVQCRRNPDGSPSIKRAGLEDFSPDASDADISKTIQRLWRHAGFRTSVVAACVDSRSLLIKFFQYPAMDPAELEAALKLEAEETLQLNPEDIFLDWYHPAPLPSAATIEGFMVAAPRTEIDRILGLMRDARLYPVALGTGCTALANSFFLTEGAIPKGTSICLVHVSGQTVDQSILLEDDRLFPYRFFSRSSDWAAGSEYLIQTLEDNLKHFQFKLQNPPVDRLILTGIIPEQEAFIDRLEKRLQIPVHTWNPCEHIHSQNVALERKLKGPDGPGPFMALSLGMSLR